MPEKTPSENEWLIMELLWKHSPMTSAEVVAALQSSKKISQKTVRVMFNRLCQKKLIDYKVDEKDSRVYHYFPLKSKAECLKEKSAHFVDSYFAGDNAGALAALIRTLDFTEEQKDELRKILDGNGDDQS